MIDVSKYEKVGEFKEGCLHWLEGRDINAVYLIKFKDDFYIGSAEYLYIRIKEHTKSFLKGEHVEKMQAVFDKEGEFDVYVIEKGIDESMLLIEEAKYIKTYTPTLNTIHATSEKSSIRSILEMKIALSGMTKKQFAEKIGRTQGSLNDMLSSPSWPSLEKMASVLGLTVQQLVSDGQPSQGELTIKCDKCGNIIKVKEIKVEQ